MAPFSLEKIMTDLDKFRSLMEEFGVPVKTAVPVTEPGVTQVTIKQRWDSTHPKVQGYNGYRAVFTFGYNGTFQHVGLWE